MHKKNAYKHTAYQLTAEEIDNTQSESAAEDELPSEDSFILYQMQAAIHFSKAKNQLPRKTHLIANIPYRIKQHQNHHKYLTSLFGYLCRCKHHAQKCIPNDVQ